MKIGEAIQGIRKKKQLSQSELSALCEISQTYLSLIEGNKKKPSLTLLELISEKLETPLPVIMFFALDENDVSKEKLELFRQMQPFIQNAYSTLWA